MAGHSKWANIKRRKEAQDNKKMQRFTRCTQAIIRAVQQGGPKVEDNPRLRLAIQQAKEINLPKANILRAIEKGAQAQQQGEHPSISYEGYAPYGVAVKIIAITDNPNRSVAHIRALLNQYGGHLGKRGETKHLFAHIRTFQIATNSGPEWEELLLQLMEAGIEDIKQVEHHTLITAPAEACTPIRDVLAKYQITPAAESLTYLPLTTCQLPTTQKAKVEACIDSLVALDDVVEVYHNLAH